MFAVMSAVIFAALALSLVVSVVIVGHARVDAESIDAHANGGRHPAGHGAPSWNSLNLG